MSCCCTLRIIVLWLFGIVVVESTLPPKLRVGSIFLEKDQEVHKAFRLGVDSLKSRNLLNETVTIDFDIQYAERNDFFHLYTRACLEVNYRIVSIFGPSEPVLDKMLESISTNLGIPLISTSPRPQKNGNGHHSASLGGGASKLTLSLHPTQSQLLDLIKDLVRELEWKDVSIIHDPLHGIIEPSALAESLQFIGGSVSIHQASSDLRATLVQLRLKGARNIIIDTGIENVPSVTQATLDTGMMTKSYSYIFTMLDMKSGNWSRLSYSEALVFGFNIIDQKKFREFLERFAPSPVTGQQMGLQLRDQTKVALTLDSVELLARGLEAFDETGTDLSPPGSTSCSEERKWEIGEELLDAFSSVSFDGLTGPISLSSGTRVKMFVDVLKLVNEYNTGANGVENPTFLTVGNWSQGINYEYEGLLIHNPAWLRNSKPSINRTLVITTIESSPCLYRSESGEDEGYCVELANHLSKLVGFNYKIKLVGDGRYGKPDALTGQWGGMIGEVLRGDADMAIADLTITASRSKVVDFSIPFLQTSLGILFKPKDVDNAQIHELGTLLSPFSIWVWISILLAFVLTSICLRLVSWLSPLQKGDIIVPGSDHHGPTFGDDLSWVNSMWLLASTLVLRGCEIRISAASSRTIAVVWWIFALVVIIIYGSLVSHWFDPDQIQGPSNVDELLQNKDLDFGVMQSSSTSFLLQNAKREDLQKIWWKIQKSKSLERSFQESIQAGIQEVKLSNGQFAFITEEANFNQALLEDCSLKVLGPIHQRSYGISVAKGSPLRDQISQALLTLGENGILHQLEAKWYPKTNCNDKAGHGKPQVQFVHFVGPLSLLLTGVIIALFIAMAERLMYHRRSHRGFFRTHTEPSSNGKIAMNDTESDQ